MSIKRADWGPMGLYAEYRGAHDGWPDWQGLTEEEQEGWRRVHTFVELPDDPTREAAE